MLSAILVRVAKRPKVAADGDACRDYSRWLGHPHGADIPKQFINVCDKPVLVYTLEGSSVTPTSTTSPWCAWRDGRRWRAHYGIEEGLERTVRMLRELA